MSTHTTGGNDPTHSADEVKEPAGAPRARWRRDHPTFIALAGFYTGLLFVIVVPGGFAGVLGLLFDFDTAERLFPLVAIALVVPVALLAIRRTRRFGAYMVLGMVLTAIVVSTVTALVLYYMVSQQQG